MSRNKYPEQTVNKILDISSKLFMEKGYDNTSMQDIVNELHMSKGAIYHHFKSKDDLLAKITERYFEDIAWFTTIKNDSTLSGLEKLRKVFFHALGNIDKLKMDALFYDYSMVKDPKLLMNEIVASVNETAPLISELLEEGIKDGSIKVKNPKQFSEMMIILINFWASPCVFKTNHETFVDKIHFLDNTFDTLGVPIFDEHLLDLCIKYYDVITSKSK